MRPELTDLERAMGATDDTPCGTLTCERCGADLVQPVFGGPLPFLVCQAEVLGECDAPGQPLPAALEMAAAGALPLPGLEPRASAVGGGGEGPSVRDALPDGAP